MNQPLEGKKAIVTGSSRGLGKAISSALIRNGAFVTICGRNESELKMTAEILFTRLCKYVTIDATNSEQIKKMFAEIT